MKTRLLKFLNRNKINTVDVSRLVVTSYLILNNIKVKKNKFIKSLTITNSETEVYEKLLDFISIIESEKSKLDLELILSILESQITKKDRIEKGAIYTPKYIREYISDESFKRNKKLKSRIKIADISCGSGSFLLTAAEKIKSITKDSYKNIIERQIYGLDIDANSINQTKLILSLLALSNDEDENFKFNLYVGDALRFDWNSIIDSFSGFDFVLGNPPYVSARNMSNETIELIKKFEVCKIGKTNLYIPFFKIGIDLLAPNGILGYITENSFYKSYNGINLRKYFSENNFNLCIIDLGFEQVFKSKYTYNCICMIQKNTVESISFYRNRNTPLPNEEIEFCKIPYSKLDSVKGWNLHNFKIITKIESIGKPFEENFETRHGLATLKNDVFIFDPVGEEKDYYYLQSDKVYPIEKKACRDIINPNKLLHNQELRDVQQKVIFPYESTGKPNIINEKHFNDKYPQTYNYLLQKKEILLERDKCKGNYKKWYSYGRPQSLEKKKYKLFFSNMSNKPLKCYISTDESLMYYNGLAVVCKDYNEMIFAKKLMESEVFWYYIKSTSKPLNGGYYSLNKLYFKNFGVCNLSDSEFDFIVNENDSQVLDSFFIKKYRLFNELNLD